MKNLIGILYVCTLAVFVSCEDDENRNTGTPPASVLDVSAEAGPGEVILKWKNPDDPNLKYVNIAYINSQSEKVSINVSTYAVDSVTGFVTDTIDGFTDTKEYTFDLTARNLSGASSDAVQIVKAPLAPVYHSIYSTITAKSDFGGVIVSWDNTLGKKAFVVALYPNPDNPSEKLLRRFDATRSGSGYVSAGLNITAIDLELYATDKYHNESEKKNVRVEVYAETEFNKSEWSVPGYVDNSQNETIGYSSQATNEGASPNGRVIAIFDKNLATFWHARWGSPATNYPHWYIIDLGKEVTISRVEMARRQGNSQGQKGQQFLTCTAAGAANPADPTTWAWEDQGSYSFDAATNNVQSYRLL
ncbi:MAG: DUF4959 domain-containing protein, partial [Prevotellaceae bacterium]|nr:DUF4959 domain-containing protein [Prevotellaceae bacterium]